jgi:hypothetical protein
MAEQPGDGQALHYDRTLLSPFDEEDATRLLLREGTRLLGMSLTVRRRWRGVYSHSLATEFLVVAPEPDVRVVSVTSGVGMTTALGLAPVVLDGLLNPPSCRAGPAQGHAPRRQRRWQAALDGSRGEAGPG